MSFRSSSLSRKTGIPIVILVYGALLPLSLDVKKMGDDTGSAFQLLLVGLTFAAGLLYFLHSQFTNHYLVRRTKLLNITALWILYLFFSIIPALAWQIEPELYLKVLLPYALFGLGLLIVVTVDQTDFDHFLLLDILLYGALIATFWRLFYAMSTGGVNFESVRWQILSPGTPFLIGYGAAGLYLRRRIKLAVVALMIGIAVVLVAVTRSYIISMFFVTAGVFIIETRRSQSARALTMTLKYLALLAIVSIISITLAKIFSPEIITRWEDRIFSQKLDTGQDITLMLRVAEYRDQLDSLTASPAKALLGNGKGSAYGLDQGDNDALSQFIASEETTFGGHSSWLYPLYSSGFIMGTTVPLILLYTLFVGLKRVNRKDPSATDKAAVFAFLIYLSYFGQTLTSNVFTERYTGLIIALVAGLLYLSPKNVPGD